MLRPLGVVGGANVLLRPLGVVGGANVLLRLCRYYYDGDMISKVQGKRFVYKFVCDLRTLIGYSAAELNGLVTECEQKKLARLQLHGLGQPVTTVTLATSIEKDS